MIADKTGCTVVQPYTESVESWKNGKNRPKKHGKTAKIAIFAMEKRRNFHKKAWGSGVLSIKLLNIYMVMFIENAPVIPVSYKIDISGLT